MAKIDPIELSKELLSCPSITPNDHGALDVVQKALDGLGFKCQRMIFEEEGYAAVDNLYARFGDQSPNFCFAGHTDVVPTGPLDDWKTDPFKPEIIDGVLYGRGVVDMKCAIACFISAVSQYLDENGKPKGSFSFLITGDEEGIAVNGTKKVLEKLKSQNEKLDACLVGEPTSVNNVGDVIKIGRRGSVTFELIVMGKQGHVAYPDLADNPIRRLNSILHALSSHSLDEGNEYFQKSNLEIVNIEVGNTADNVIPARAKAVFNIRFNDKHKSSTLIKWIESICDSMCETGDATYDLKHRITGESFITKPGKLSDMAKNACKVVAGINADLNTAGGTSDARFIKDLCPVIELGLRNATAHKIDENAPVEDIRKLTDIYLHVLKEYFA